MRGRGFSWEESPPHHLGCQAGMGRVESCKLPPARRDAATSCLSLGLLFPAKQAACVARCLAWHVREQEESAPLPESPARLSPFSGEFQLAGPGTWLSGKPGIFCGRGRLRRRGCVLVQRTLSRCFPLKPSECAVCLQASLHPQMLLVELFLAVDGFLLCTVGLSRSREEGKAPTLKTQLKICQMHPLPPPKKENARRYIRMATFLMTSYYRLPSVPAPTFPNRLCTPRIKVDDKYQGGVETRERVCFYSETLIHSFMYSCIHSRNFYETCR